ncbi:MAG: hypothetical protein KDE27_17380 [Planctomycetes bacterium]|nr:hypothetical protein [Planctomycetota bacterium]
MPRPCFLSRLAGTAAAVATTALMATAQCSPATFATPADSPGCGNCEMSNRQGGNTTLPRLGTSFSVEITAVAYADPFWLLGAASLSASALPSPPFLAGCNSYLGSGAAVLYSSVALNFGPISAGFSIPNDPALCGATLYLQATVQDHHTLESRTSNLGVAVLGI